jgi:hypothetical protein
MERKREKIGEETVRESHLHFGSRQPENGRRLGLASGRVGRHA